MPTPQEQAKIAVECATLDEFFDGEAPEYVATAFRQHLADCERCAKRLHGRMLEALVTDDPFGTAPQHPR
jgi:anti-sigma factor RsiW